MTGYQGYDRIWQDIEPADSAAAVRGSSESSEPGSPRPPSDDR